MISDEAGFIFVWDFQTMSCVASLRVHTSAVLTLQLIKCTFQKEFLLSYVLPFHIHVMSERL